MKNTNEIRTGKCIDYTFDGQGVVKIDNRIIFVPGLLKDEEAEIEILYHKKDFDVGKIKKINKLSKDRVEPRCKVANSCGGCTFMNLSYDKQIELKTKRVEDALSKIAKVPAKLEHFYKMDNPFNYRNKIQVPYRYDKQKRLVYGFFKAKTHDVVYSENCAIQDERASKILKTLQNLIISFKIAPYNEDLRKGLIRHVLIRTGYYSKEIMVVLVTTNEEFKGKNNFIKELIRIHPEITTVIQNYNSLDTNVILGQKEQVLYGPGFIYDSLCGVKFKISSKSFYQTNPIQTEVLYSLAINKANLNKNDVILDAYCGIGTIGLIASKNCKEVYGVEIVKEAIEDAKINAKLNNFSNAHYECNDAKNYILNKNFDCIFVDPPRKGLDEEFINSLLKSNCKKIVYISCDPETLARDLFKLKVKYNIESVNCVDMFAHTSHCETVCLLTKK